MKHAWKNGLNTILVHKYKEIVTGIINSNLHFWSPGNK